MAECGICEQIEKKKLFVIYEDADIVAALAPNPATIGYVWVMPKKHFTIIEEVPDAIAGKLFSISNKVSSALFEGLNAQGTNIMIQNGSAAGQSAPHLIVHVIARRENDGLNFQWITKKISDEEMSLAELQLKEDAKKIVVEKEKRTEVIKGKEVEKLKDNKDNYMLRQLNRLP